MNLKNTLKVLKLNEPTISTVLGALVILALGIGLVNYLKSRTTPIPATLPGSQTSQEENLSLPQTHKVAQGESLWKIAEKYYKSGYNWMDIAQANKMANANFLAVGQELTIPDVQPKLVQTNQAQANAPPAKDTKPDTTIGGEAYDIIQGDHLWGIAVRAYGDGYQWTKIWQANKAQIKNPNLIYPGQKLTLPKKE